MNLSSVAQFSFILTAILTVAGWFIVAGQADRREFRKEVRELVRDLRDRLQNVNQTATTYWLSTGVGASTAAISLKADVLSLSRQILTLHDVGVEVDPSLVAAIRVAATGGDFEKKGRRRSVADKSRLIELVNAIEDLLLEVDRAFYRLFPPIRSKRLWRFVPFIGLLGLGSDQSD